MSVRFILGRAGSGKTQYCLESVRGGLAQGTNRRPHLLLVPEQSTAITERALLATGSIPGFVGHAVVSFRRLGHLVAREVGAPNPRFLGPSAQNSLVAAGIETSKESLRFFGRVADHPGFRAEIGRFVRETRRYRVSGRELEQAARHLQRNDPDLRDKLHDLALICRNVAELMPAECGPPEGLLDSLIDSIPRSGFLEGARVWVDGFAGFTVQEEEVLGQLAGACQQLEIALCLDPDRALDSSVQAHEESESLFRPTEETYSRLLERFQSKGVAVDDPVCLPTGQARQRFTLGSALAHVERHWGAIPVRAFPHPAPEVALVECADRRTEVAAAATEILRLCRKEGFRYRDIGILVRDLEPYRHLFEAEFPSRGVPFFCDLPTSLSAHPLPVALRSALSAVVNDLRREDVVDYVKTGLSPADRADCDLLDERATAWGVTGDTWWSDAPWAGEEAERLSDLTEARDRALRPLAQLQNSLVPPGSSPRRAISVRDFCTAVFRFLGDIQAGRTLEEWHRQDSERSFHRQVWEALLELLDDWAAGAGDLEFPVADCAAQLQSSLRELRLRSAPPTLDQVLVGSVEHSRQPDLRVAMVLGLNEGHFPRPKGDDLLLPDGDRAALAGRGIRLGLPPDILRAREWYLGYIAITRPAQRLWLSYALSEAGDKALLPSPWIRDVREMFPACRVEEREAAPEPRSLHDLCVPSDVPAQLLRVLRRSSVDESLRRDWLPILKWSFETRFLRPGWKQAFRSLEYRNRAALDRDLAARLYDHELVMSVSRLECFAACPFQHFAAHVLNLAEPREYRVEPVDLGQLFHRVLCRLFRRLEAERKRWSELDEATAGVWVAEEVMRAAAGLRGGLFLSTGALQFRTELARRALVRLVKSLIRRDAESEFHQQAAEVSFGFEGGGLPPLTVPLSGRRQLLLRGRIDRIDATASPGDGEQALLVIDYKTSGKAPDLAAVFHGLEMQLPSYLLATTDRRGPKSAAVPAGAVYLHVVEPIRASKAGGTAACPDTRKARGILNGEYVRRLDTTCEKGGSEHFQFFIRQDGELGNLTRSDAVPPEILARLLEKTRRNLALYGDRILGGEVAVHPYRVGTSSPCSLCAFRSVCRIERGLNRYRSLPTMKRDEVLAELEEGS